MDWPTDAKVTNALTVANAVLILQPVGLRGSVRVTTYDEVGVRTNGVVEVLLDPAALPTRARRAVLPVHQGASASSCIGSNPRMARTRLTAPQRSRSTSRATAP
jgi:hypothetical protein